MLDSSRDYFLRLNNRRKLTHGLKCSVGIFLLQIWYSCAVGPESRSWSGSCRVFGFDPACFSGCAARAEVMNTPRSSSYICYTASS